MKKLIVALLLISGTTNAQLPPNEWGYSERLDTVRSVMVISDTSKPMYVGLYSDLNNKLIYDTTYGNPSPFLRWEFGYTVYRRYNLTLIESGWYGTHTKLWPYIVEYLDKNKLPFKKGIVVWIAQDAQ